MDDQYEGLPRLDFDAFMSAVLKLNTDPGEYGVWALDVDERNAIRAFICRADALDMVGFEYDDGLADEETIQAVVTRKLSLRDRVEIIRARGLVVEVEIRNTRETAEVISSRVVFTREEPAGQDDYLPSRDE